MRWTLALLLVLLTISTTIALSNSIIPGELRVRVSEERPILEVPSPTVSDGRIFALGDDGSLLISIATNGEKIWSHKLGARAISPPLVIPNAFYGHAKKESWVIVATNSFELWAFDSSTGGLRIERLRLPSAPSGAPLYYLGDGKTVLVPLTRSIQAINIRLKSNAWSIDLGFKPKYVKYFNSVALAIGEHEAAYLNISSREAVWSIDLGEKITSYGSDGRDLAVLLDNGTMVSIRVADGQISGFRDLRAVLGYDIPEGEFPIIDGIATVTGSKGIMYFVNVSTLQEALRPMRTWTKPIRQPLAIDKALIYLSKEEIKVYHFPRRFLLSEFKVNGLPYGGITLAKSQENHTNIMAYVDEYGYLHVIRLPDYWIKAKAIEKHGDGYIVYGYVCSTATSGPRYRVKLYSISLQGEILGEKFIGILGPGDCGTGFSTLVKTKGAIGLIVGDDRLLPNIPVGITRDEWISYKPSGNVTTTTTAPVTQTTSAPLIKPIFMAIAPEEVEVGDEIEIKISGINGWNVTDLTFSASGSTIEENKTSIIVNKGSSFELLLKTKALRPGNEDIIVKVQHNARVLNETRIPLSVSIGKIIQGIGTPSSVEVNKSAKIKVILVNRYEDNASLSLRVTFDGQTKDLTVGPLAAGETITPTVTITPGFTGNLKLKLQIIAPNGEVIDELSSFIPVISPKTVPKTVTSPYKPQRYPFPIEYIIAVIAIIFVISALAIVLTRPRGKKVAEKAPQVSETEVAPTPIKGPPEVEEEIPQVPIKGEEAKEEEVTPPEIEEEEIEIPQVPSPRVPSEIMGRLERDMSVTRRRLEEIKKTISRLEEIVGFEVSPYKLVEAETSLISAEMKLKEGKAEEAEDLLKKIDESLTNLEAEVSEAEKSLIENWSAVENRIDIMLRVWGKAPANMLTMVPAGFRIVALERFRRLHPDRKLELRGDELIALEE